MVHRRRDTPLKQPAEGLDAIHLKHLRNAYTGVWDDTHRVKQLHYCLYEPWREWVESCCDDFVALIRRKGYTSVLALILSHQHSSASALHADISPDTLLITREFSKNVFFESLYSIGNLIGENIPRPSQKQPSEVLKSEMVSLTRLLEMLMRFVLLGDEEVSKTLLGVSSARQQNTTNVTEEKVKPPPQALATSVTSSSHLLFSHFTHESSDIKNTIVQPRAKKTRSEHCDADDSSRGNSDARRGSIDVDCLLDFLLELVTCPPAALGSRLSLLLQGQGPQWKEASSASIRHTTPSIGHYSLASERLPFLNCVSIDEDHDHDDYYYVDNAVSTQKEWRDSTFPSIGPCGSAPFSVRLTSNMPCEVFEGSTTLFSEMAAMITPSEYQAMLLFLSCLEEVFTLVRRSVVTIMEANEGSCDGRLQLTSGGGGGGLRRQRELAASFLQDLEHFLKFLRVAKTHLIIEDDGDPSDPFQLKTNASARDGMVAGVWDSDLTISAILETRGPFDCFSACSLSSDSTTATLPPASTVREATTATPIPAVLFPQGDRNLTAVSLLQGIVLRGLHFAPQSPKWDDDEGRYAFESLIDGTDASQQRSRLSSTDEGADPSAENRLSRVSRRSRAVLPPSFFSGPSGPQCCVGSFIGFGLVMKALREGKILKSVAPEVGSDKGRGDDGGIASTGTSKKRGRRAASRSGRCREIEESAKDTVCDTLADDAISLNGPVIILGMGGNVALNLLAEQLLAPTAAGEAFLKANPLFSLHVVELEPSVMRTCAANGLLPGYESANVDATYTCGGEVFHVKRSIHLPSWASSHVRHGTLTDAFAKYNRNVQSRVYYHVGVDAMACDLQVLVGDAVRTRRVGSAASVNDNSKGPQDCSAAAELILLDCFDPLMKQMDDPVEVLSLFRSALSPTGMLCVNSHMNPADLNRGGEEEGRSKAKGSKKRKNSKSDGATVSSPLSPFVNAFIDPTVRDEGTHNADKEGRLFSSLGLDGSVSALQFNALSQFFVVMTKRAASDGRHGTSETTQTSSHDNTNSFCKIVTMDGRESRTTSRVQQQQRTEREDKAVARLPLSFSSLATALAHLLSFELTRRFFLGNFSFCWDLLLDSASTMPSGRSIHVRGYGHGGWEANAGGVSNTSRVGVSNSKEARGIAASILRSWGVTRLTSIRVPLLQPRPSHESINVESLSLQLSQSRDQLGNSNNKRGTRPVREGAPQSTRNGAKKNVSTEYTDVSGSTCCHYDTPIWCA